MPHAVHAAKRESVERRPGPELRRTTRASPQPETRAYVRGFEAERVTDCDDGGGPCGVVDREPCRDVGEDGTATTAAGAEVALVGPDRLLEHGEQEALLRRRDRAPEELAREDDVGLDHRRSGSHGDVLNRP